MRFLNFISHVILQEGAKDRYLQQFNQLFALASQIDDFTDPNQRSNTRAMQEEVTKEIQWAMKTLKKSDKIAWYLKIAKYAIWRQWIKSAKELETDEQQMQAEESFSKYQNKLLKGFNTHMFELNYQSNTFDLRLELDHFMSLDIPAIEEMTLTWELPQKVINNMRVHEQKWQEATRREIPRNEEDDIEVLISYGNSAWVDLDRPYCEIEGDAMGHCGNRAEYREDDTVLSYREIGEGPRGKFWKPKLTFILHGNGMLGEMKGYANNKPDSKYHPVIVDLLRLPIVKGIIGGGYAPEENFDMEDLNETVREQLIAEKPALGSIDRHFEMAYDAVNHTTNEESQAVIERMMAILKNVEDRYETIKFDTNSHVFSMRLDFSVEQFISHLDNSDLEYAMRILEDGSDGHDLGNMSIRDFWDILPSRLQNEVRNAVEHYLGYETELEFDITDDDELIEQIETNDELDEILSAMHQSMYDGIEHGISKEAYESVTDYLKDIGLEFENWDVKTVFMHFAPQRMAPILSDEDFIYESERNQSILDGIIQSGKIDHYRIPNYGFFEGFDEEAAINYFEAAIEQL